MAIESAENVDFLVKRMGYDDRITVLVDAPAQGKSMGVLLRWLAATEMGGNFLRDIPSLVWIDGRDWFLQDTSLSEVQVRRLCKS